MDHVCDLFEEGGGILYWVVTVPCQILMGIVGLAIMVAMIIGAFYGLYDYINPRKPIWKDIPAFKAEYAEAKKIVELVESEPETHKAASEYLDDPEMHEAASKYLNAYEESKLTVERWEAE